MYHILKRRSFGSYQTPSLKTIAMPPCPFRSHGLSGRTSGLSAWGDGVWNTRRSVVSAMRKSSTKSCRPTSVGMTAGGVFRYGGVTGWRGISTSFGGQGEDSLMPLYSVSASAGPAVAPARAAAPAVPRNSLRFIMDVLVAHDLGAACGFAPDA